MQAGGMTCSAGSVLSTLCRIKLCVMTTKVHFCVLLDLYIQVAASKPLDITDRCIAESSNALSCPSTKCSCSSALGCRR